MQLPSWSCYCDNTTEANALVFDLPNGLRVWFSYKTPVAFWAGANLYVRENEWGPTTGKHLNAIDHGNKKARISGEQFEKMLRRALVTP